MPNARGEITTTDLRMMRELHSQDVPHRTIAKIVGVGETTVRRYVGRHAMFTRVERYTAFVERAAPYVPLLVSPSPF